jgi:hypothetical protein
LLLVFAESAAWLGLAMSLATADLPADPDALRAFALACQAELKAAELSVQLRSLEIEKLKFQIAKLRRMQFGRPSERISRQIEQLELQLEELQTGEAEAIAAAMADDRPEPIRAKPKRSLCRIICRARRSCINLTPTVHASALTAAPAWRSSVRM